MSTITQAKPRKVLVRDTAAGRALDQHERAALKGSKDLGDNFQNAETIQHTIQPRAIYGRTPEQVKEEAINKHVRLQEIRDVMKDFSGSLERQLHPKSQFEEENRNRSYLPRRFDVREMKIRRTTAQEKILENESYLQKIDSKVATLENEAAAKVD